jgi:hypothetical protein
MHGAKYPSDASSLQFTSAGIYNLVEIWVHTS